LRKAGGGLQAANRLFLKTWRLGAARIDFFERHGRFAAPQPLLKKNMAGFHGKIVFVKSQKRFAQGGKTKSSSNKLFTGGKTGPVKLQRQFSSGKPVLPRGELPRRAEN
jgi:hypothetical protein